MDVLMAMRTFRRVAERSSFSQAAADLGQSTAAVSKQVRQLEERLGSLLILRTTRRMSLSEAGSATSANAATCWTSWTPWNGPPRPACTNPAGACGSMRRCPSGSRCCRRSSWPSCSATRNCRWT